MRKQTILYIHGFNGSPNGSTGTFVKDYFSEDDIIAPQFDLLDFDGTLDKIKEIINNNAIHIIVAHSFGAFYAFALNDEMFKIVINPCMLPSIEIPKLSKEPLDENWIKKFEHLEEKIYSSVTGEICQTTFGIFGKDDELFSYKDVYKKIYGTNSLRNIDNFVSLPGSHYFSKDFLERGLSRAMHYAEVFSPSLFLEKKNERKLCQHNYF